MATKQTVTCDCGCGKDLTESPDLAYRFVLFAERVPMVDGKNSPTPPVPPFTGVLHFATGKCLATWGAQRADQDASTAA